MIGGVVRGDAGDRRAEALELDGRERVPIARLLSWLEHAGPRNHERPHFIQEPTGAGAMKARWRPPLPVHPLAAAGRARVPAPPVAGRPDAGNPPPTRRSASKGAVCQTPGPRPEGHPGRRQAACEPTCKEVSNAAIDRRPIVTIVTSDPPRSRSRSGTSRRSSPQHRACWWTSGRPGAGPAAPSPRSSRSSRAPSRAAWWWPRSTWTRSRASPSARCPGHPDAPLLQGWPGGRHRGRRPAEGRAPAPSRCARLRAPGSRPRPTPDSRVPLVSPDGPAVSRAVVARWRDWSGEGLEHLVLRERA